MLIGLTGPAGSGKDTVAHILATEHNFTKVAFADNLKLAASKIFDLPLIAFYHVELKEVVDPYWGFSPREMLQKLGTEACRNVFGEDIWINSMLKALTTERLSIGHVVITDLRFENEAKAVRDRGGFVIHIESNRKSVLNKTAQKHASEAGVSKHYYDNTLYNTGTLEQLPAKVTSALYEIISLESLRNV